MVDTKVLIVINCLFKRRDLKNINIYYKILLYFYNSENNDLINILHSMIYYTIIDASDWKKSE